MMSVLRSMRSELGMLRQMNRHTPRWMPRLPRHTRRRTPSPSSAPMMRGVQMLRRRIPHIDSDFDRVPNRRDCSPLNPFRQDKAQPQPVQGQQHQPQGQQPVQQQMPQELPPAMFGDVGPDWWDIDPQADEIYMRRRDRGTMQRMQRRGGRRTRRKTRRAEKEWERKTENEEKTAPNQQPKPAKERFMDWLFDRDDRDLKQRTRVTMHRSDVTTEEVYGTGETETETQDIQIEREGESKSFW